MIKKYIYLVLIGVIFGSQFLITKKALIFYSPLEVCLIRLVFGAIFVTLYAIFFSDNKPAPSTSWLMYIWIGFLEGTLPCLLVPWGVTEVKSSIVAVLISTISIFTVLLGPLFFKKDKFKLNGMISIVLGFIGVCVLIKPNISATSFSKLIMPELAILLASASWALSLIFIKKLPAGSPIKLTRNILIASSCELLILWFILGNPNTFRFEATPFLYAMILGIFASGIVYIFYVLLINLAGVYFTSLSNYLIPIVGVALGTIFLHEKLSIHEVAGICIIFIGLIIQTFYSFENDIK